MSKIAITVVTVWLWLISTTSAHAYLDPGSGSMILQVLLGGLLSVAVVIKFYWNRLLSFLGISKGKDEDCSDSTDS